MPDQIRAPFPREKFIPSFSTMPQPERLVYLIETRQELKKKYRTTYQNVIKALNAVRSKTDPTIAEMTSEQLAILEDHLVKARDEVARGFTQTVKLYENTANELFTGVFPHGPQPLGSFDLSDWIEKICGWIAGLLREIGDVFGHLGMPEVEAGLDWAADGIEWLGDKAGELLNPEE